VKEVKESLLRKYSITLNAQHARGSHNFHMVNTTMSDYLFPPELEVTRISNHFNWQGE
jgi:hypothetical protein